MTQNEKAQRLRALHKKGSPVVLPNVWDAASARLVVEAGFEAVATTSAGVAHSLGYEDHHQAPPDEMFAALARIVRAVDVPVTADLEGGYGLDTEDIAIKLLATGAVGCNLEDTDHGGSGMFDVERHAEWLADVKLAAGARGVDIVLNARTDAFILQQGTPEQQLAESIRRGRMYLSAGADCVYPILATGEEAIATLVREIEGPVNVLAHPQAPPLEKLVQLGVARISLGPQLHRWAMAEVKSRLEKLRAALAR